MKPHAVYSITVRGIPHFAKGYAEDALKKLSETYCALRDASGEGASTFPSPNITRGGKPVAHISYNGRVWAGTAKNFDVRSAVLLYDNRVALDQSTNVCARCGIIIRPEGDHRCEDCGRDI